MSKALSKQWSKLKVSPTGEKLSIFIVVVNRRVGKLVIHTCILVARRIGDKGTHTSCEFSL